MSKTVINKREQFKFDNGFAPSGKNIPDITAADEGKFVKVVDGVLVFGDTGSSVLPEITAEDEGKVLKVESGAAEWGTDEGITYTAGDNIAISADNEISSVNTVVFDVKYIRNTDTFQYDDTAIEPFLTEVFKNDKRAIVRVQDGNYNVYDIYTLHHYESYNKIATFSKTRPIIVSADQREIVCSHIGLAVVGGVGTLSYTNEGVTDLPQGATAGQIPVSDGHNGWVAGNIPTELPSVTSVDEGKVLKVDANGDWAVGTDNDTTYTAGSNVQINGSVISATDTTYSAGSNISISAENVISATDTTYTAGANVQINDGVISATDTVYTLPTADASTLGGVKVGTNLSIDGNGVLSATDTTYTAGTNVQINNGVISATDTTYSAGTNVSINAQNEISAVDTTYSAGTGISIDGSNVISADAQLPTVTSADEGKVLKVDANGDWSVGTDNNTTYSAGANITIDANNEISATDTTYSAGSGITITGTVIAADDQLPSYSSTENGKVLSVDSNGDLEWVTPSGGSETWEIIGAEDTGLSLKAASQSAPGTYSISLNSGVDLTQYNKIVVEGTYSGQNWDNDIVYPVLGTTNGSPLYMQIVGYKTQDFENKAANEPFTFMPWTILSQKGSSASSSTWFPFTIYAYIDNSAVTNAIKLYVLCSSPNRHMELKFKIYGVK